MSALHPLPAKQDAPGPSREHPPKRPSPRPYPPRQPLQARLPTWWLAVREAVVPHPFLCLGSYIAKSAMFVVSPGTRRQLLRVRGKGCGGRLQGVGGRAKAFYSPPKPPPATEHAQLPGVAPRRTFREHTQLFRVFVAAGGRQAVAAAGGGGGEVSGEDRGCVYSPQSPELGKASFCPSNHTCPLPSRAGAAPARSLSTHFGFAEISCRTYAGLSFAKEESKEWEGAGLRDPSASFIASTWTRVSQT